MNNIIPLEQRREVANRIADSTLETLVPLLRAKLVEDLITGFGIIELTLKVHEHQVSDMEFAQRKKIKPA